MVGNCLALELPAASFDLAVDNHVLHCIVGADRARFLREVARVLRPGGLFFSDTMSRVQSATASCGWLDDDLDASRSLVHRRPR